MNIDNLIVMANQIGTFFASYPDQAEASTEIGRHLKRFWAPRMRHQLFAYIDSGGIGLTPIVLTAIVEHRRDQAVPPPPGGDAG